MLFNTKWLSLYLNPKQNTVVYAPKLTYMYEECSGSVTAYTTLI